MAPQPLRPQPEGLECPDSSQPVSRQLSAWTKRRALVRRPLREPLLHFLLVGALIFTTYELLNSGADRTVQANRIVLTEDDLRQLAVRWLAQGRPPPSSDEMRALVEQRVSEEIH
jgi:peptidyl-prolyl cis-trans isomerase C